MPRKTIDDILEKKQKAQRIVMLTASDYASARLVDEAEVDIILVGDSLANVVLGYDKTSEVTMEEMLHHAKAVNRAVSRALLVGDMPYEAYQSDARRAVENARRYRDEAGASAVKLEWFRDCVEVSQSIIQAGVPVMGHVGLTPQTAREFKVQGKDAQSAQEIFDHALALEKAGVFSLVLECVPDLLAKKISENLSVPTIGIGSGVHCDGQVLVTHDLLGWADGFKPKFVKQYADIRGVSLTALNAFCRDVKDGNFPDDAHSYHMKTDEIRKVKGQA